MKKKMKVKEEVGNAIDDDYDEELSFLLKKDVHIEEETNKEAHLREKMPYLA